MTQKTTLDAQEVERTDLFQFNTVADGLAPSTCRQQSRRYPTFEDIIRNEQQEVAVPRNEESPIELKIKDMIDIIENNHNIWSFLDEGANEGEHGHSDSLVLNQDSESVLKMKANLTMQENDLKTNNSQSCVPKVQSCENNFKP